MPPAKAGGILFAPVKKEERHAQKKKIFPMHLGHSARNCLLYEKAIAKRG
jgi:hypothetical protein